MAGLDNAYTEGASAPPLFHAVVTLWESGETLLASSAHLETEETGHRGGVMERGVVLFTEESTEGMAVFGQVLQRLMERTEIADVAELAERIPPDEE